LKGLECGVIKKVCGEFSLACTVHNFRKIIKGIMKGNVCLKARSLKSCFQIATHLNLGLRLLAGM